MDPDAALAALRAHATLILQQVDAEQQPDLDDVIRLAEASLAVDQWMTAGGRTPRGWGPLRGVR